jgi:NAD(P)-dependent dehydrogenase (short-subunit alcohol dehydrogenase family)
MKRRKKMPDMLKGRVAIVTGAGNGLGRAEAIALSTQGAQVVVNDLGTSHDGIGLSSEAADCVVEQIKQAGGNAVASYDSVATEEGANRIIRLAVEKFGRVDVLVNNAGIIRVQPVWEIPTEDWDAVIKTHLYGTFYCTRAASAIMKQQGYGRIICTSSAVGFGVQGQSTYSAAKEGITGFARSVARDMAKYGTTCNIIRPVAAWRGAQQRSGMVDVNQPSDIAPLVVYLASEQSDHINGCIFEVWHGHVGIFVDPPPVEQVVWKDGQWTPEELMKVLPETLTVGRSREHLPFTLPYMFRNMGKQNR